MKLIPVDPVHLSVKGKFLSVVACFITIFMIAWMSQQFKLNAAYPILVASMGPSALMLFIIPSSPLAQPWPVVGGHLVSAVIGITCAQLVPDIALSSAYAVGGSVLAMLLLRCLHPPGAASALAPILSGAALAPLGFSYVLMPIGLNVTILMIMAIVFNRWLLRHEYPIKTRQAPENKSIRGITPQPQQTGISEQDIEQALLNMDTFMDVTSMDLSKLLSNVQLHRFMQKNGSLTCADIMYRDCLAVEYGTEVEEAWHLMHKENIKALPVIDRSRRVIGIVTWHDFFKFIKLDADQTFQEKILAFIRRTPDISTNKPESVGHIMTSQVTLLKENAHIANLVPLMSANGHRQIPIVNNENRLVGMVYQANLIAALYNETH